MIASVLVFFLHSRDLNEEFFIRRNLINLFESTYKRDELKSTIKPLQPFSQIKSTKEFNLFLQSSIPELIFTEDETETLAFTY